MGGGPVGMHPALQYLGSIDQLIVKQKKELLESKYLNPFMSCGLFYHNSFDRSVSSSTVSVSFYYGPAVLNGWHIVSSLSACTSRPSSRTYENTKNGFRSISLEKIGVKNSYFTHEYKIIKYRSGSI